MRAQAAVPAVSATLALLAALAVVAPALPPADARAQGCSGSVPPTPGTVTPLPGPCPGGAGPVPNTICRVLRVECGGLSPLDVQLRETPPAPMVEERGTVVFGSGGNGASFYSGQSNAHLLFQDLAGMGFRVLERSWPGPDGWFTAEGGLRREACRYATLMAWIRDSVHLQGALVSTGNSGGSAELGYGFTTYLIGDFVDLAVPTGGPPLSRMDYHCGQPTPAEWQALCPGIVPADSLDCTPGCVIPPTHPACLQCNPAPTLAELRFNSMLHPDALLSYPGTKVHFIFGRNDCTSAVPMGMLWHEAVPTAKELQFIPGTPHFVAGTVQGREAIRKAIDLGTQTPVSARGRGVVADGVRLRVGPSPTAGATTFRLGLPAPQRVRLTLHDVAGRLLATLADGELPAGEHELGLGAGTLPPGVLFYRLGTERGNRRGTLVRIAR